MTVIAGMPHADPSVPRDATARSLEDAMAASIACLPFWKPSALPAKTVTK